jgi:N-acetylglutamate synthase-like GNAT family acetyltransferase
MSQPKPSFKTRQAEYGDEEAIRFLLSGFKLPLDGLENTQLWILNSHDAILGVAGLEIYGKQGLLRSVAVNKDLQRQGFGAFLVKHVITEAKIAK